MPQKGRKKEGHEQAAEHLKKAGEDLERAAGDLSRKMKEEERKKPANGKAEEHAKLRETKPRESERAREKPARAKKAAEPKGKPAAADIRGAKWIESVNEHEDHQGQSLATRNHDVIMRWAEERKAQPATIEGTEHEGRPGVLRFDFPGYGGGIKQISWDEWFKTFDARELTFLYQEHLKNGSQSNFFKLTSPHREDG